MGAFTMTPQLKKRLAKEWLTLVICLFIGLLLPLYFMLVRPSVASDGIGETYLELLSGLFSRRGIAFEERFIAWAVVLGPYLIYQFVRSIIWAVRALRTT
jgi:hypothetical protein